MGFCSVNKDTCTGDMFCIKECPLNLFSFDENEKIPVAVEGAEDLCIGCGHCVAVCPHGALSLERMKASDCELLEADWKLDPEKAGQFLKGRRSIRKYKQEKVDKALLEKVIDLSRYAPTAKNIQPLDWMVVYEKEKLREIGAQVIDWMNDQIEKQSPMVEALWMEQVVEAWNNGKDPIFRRAPHLIIPYAHKDNPVAPQSATIALTYLELAAIPLGLGTCWAGFFQIASGMWEPVCKALELPDGFIPLGGMMVGYPDVKFYRIPKRKESLIYWK